MPAAPSTYPALVERAIRLIELRGRPIDAAELSRELFGAAGGPWAKLLEQVLRGDGRVRRLEDGRYGAADRLVTLPGPLASPPVASATTMRPAGLVVFGAGPKPWRDPIVAIGVAGWVGDRLDRREWLVRPAEPCRVPGYLARYGIDA